MKKIIYSVIAVTMLATGCGKEKLDTGSPTSEVRFNVTAEEGDMMTRAGETEALHYTMEIYELPAAGTEIPADIMPTVEINSKTDKSFTTLLKEGNHYTALFWADYDTDETEGDYNTANLQAVTVNGNPSKEAFFGKETFTFTSAQTSFNVTLTRAVAKINLVETGVIAPNSSLKIEFNQHTTFDAETGGVSGQVARTENIDLSAGADGSTTSVTLDSSIYLFANAEAGEAVTTIDKVQFTMTSTPTGQTTPTVELFEVTNVQLKANRITNIIGEYSNP